jgi:PAS domain S-box-containing protein
MASHSATLEPLDSRPLFGAVLDALPAHIAILDETGSIVAVNETWRLFVQENGLVSPTCGVGSRYREVCAAATGLGETEAEAVVAGIGAILDGAQKEFSLEYSCAGGLSGRYFVARATAFPAGDRFWAVVAHEEITQRKEVERALRVSEARFRSLIENASDVITILDAEGTIQNDSPSASRLLGYRPGEWLGRSFFDFIHADDLPRVIADFARSLERPERMISLECQCRHRDGSWRIIEGTAKNLLSDPSVAGVVVNFREVTERKRAEEAQARLTAVMDWTPNFVSISDTHGRLYWVNRATRRLLGLGEDASPAQMNLTDLHPQWVSDLLLHEAIPAATSDGVWSGEAALLDASGEEIPVLQVVLAHKSASGGVEFFSTIAHDITERKRTEAALRESDEVFRQIAENINEMLWIFDLDQGKPVYISPGYERIWGRPLESVYDDPASFLASIAPADRTRIGSVVNVKDEEGRDEEFRLDRPDGALRWLRGRSFPIHDARGSVCRIVGLTEDVTARKQMETELRQAQRLEAIGSLSAGIAHEINTPIQYVGDNIRFLQEGFDDLATLLDGYAELQEAIGAGGAPEDLVERLRASAEEMDLEYILEEIPRAAAQSLEGVERVAEIVRAMKEFSHPGSSEKTPIDVNKSLQSTLTVARNEWKYLAELVLELDPDLPPVPCYPSELNQAVLNIVINAAHAIGDVVGDGTEDRGTLTVRTLLRDGCAEIQIQDSGSGIPGEVQRRIFDPFFTTKEVGRGTGQGLTLAHSVIVDKHGGSLHFETAAGRGTTFFIRLPLQPAGASTEHESQ